MKIVVTIKQVPATGADKRYTDAFRLDRAAVEAIINPLDEYAIEQALRLADDGKVESVAYLSMGPETATEALRRALAMGGDEAYLVTDAALAGADEWATARVLAAALDKLAPDVALMGMASDDARGSLVPGAVAATRDVALLSYGSELALADGEAQVRRLSADELRGAALTRVTEARPPEAKAPTERIENVAADEAASRIADWLAARK